MKWSFYNVYVPDARPEKVIIFNTLTRSIVRLTLGADFSGKTPPEKLLKPEQLPQLKKQGLICDDEIDEAKVFAYLTAKNRYSAASLGFWLSLTSACNFACPYCFESNKNTGHDAKYLSEADWGRILLFINNRIKNEGLKNLNVVFFGGEPLLNYPVLLKAARDLGGLSKSLKVSSSLITNTSLLDKERCRELSRYIATVQISIDGLPEDHDRLRPYADGRGSFDDILRNTGFAVEFFKGVVISIGVSESNTARIPKFLDFLAAALKDKKNVALGFRLINPAQNDAQHCPSIVEDNVRQLSAFRRQAIALGFYVGKDFISGPCMYRTPNGLVLDESLNVYPCPAYLYLDPVARLGAGGALEDFRPGWYESVTEEPKCASGCKYGPICYGGCKFVSKDGAVTCPKKVNDNMLDDRIRVYMESLDALKARRAKEPPAAGKTK